MRLALVLFPTLLLFLFFSLSLGTQHVHLNDWVKVGRVRPTDKIHFMLALKQRNLEKLKKVLLAVSDPDSFQYGKYLTLKEVSDLIAPEAAIRSKIANFFLQSGATQVKESKSKDFLEVFCPASVLESLLDVSFYNYKHKASGRVIRRTPQKYTFPSLVTSHVDVITGLHDFFDFPHERRAIRKMYSRASKQKRSDEESDEAEDSASSPDIEGRINGGDGDISPGIIIYCLNGKTTSQTHSPCSDQTPSVTVESLVMEVFPEGHDPITIQQNLTNNPAHSCILNGANETVCYLHLNVPKFRRLQILVQTRFTNGQQSIWTKYPTSFSPSPYVTPQTIYDFYKVPLNTRASNPKNSQSVVAFEQQYISLSDLSSFFAEMGLPDMTPVIHGENNPSQPGGESTLDIQYVMGVGAGVNTTFWSVSGDPGHGGYILEWAKEISDTEDAPLVTSISYGDTEDAYYKKFGSWDYINRMEIELVKMGARGLTVIAGSGDAGASNVGEAGNDLSPADPTCLPMRPFYPSDSAYVTSVSSTFLTTNALPICFEKLSFTPIQCSQLGEAAVGVSQGLFWTTGGGFSNLTAVQPWQQNEVAQYLQLSKKNPGDLPPPQYWNSSGRGYPDISTIGHNLLMVLGGQITPVDGTSASGPVLAGLISLLNDARLNAGLPSLGWLNPWLYKVHREAPEAFRDVVVGHNFDGDIQTKGSPYATFCPYGYTTKPGWDAVTGLGTPNFEVLKKFALNEGQMRKKVRLN